MERELMASGIGGQGVQLAAQVIARAAASEGKSAMFFGVYSGVMRGGNTDATVVIADAPIESPPIVSRTWSAMLLHHAYWEPLRPKIRPGGVVVVNGSVFEGALDRETHRVFEVPANEIAARVASELAASMVMVGAYVGLTGIVELESAIGAMRESLPPYRQKHAPGNEAAIRAGFDAVERLAAPAWTDAPAAARSAT